MNILSENKNNTSIALFASSLAIALSILCLYMIKESIIYSDYENIGLILGFALFCINISSVNIFFRISYNRQQVIYILICLIIPLLISWTNQYYFRYIFLLGYLFFLITIWQSFASKFWSFFFLCFALGITFLHLVPAILNNDINAASPVFFEALQLGKVHIDTLFHVSIANMIQTYGTISTGIDGLATLNYHIGSHYYLAHVSKIFGQTTLFGYNFFFFISIIPLFIYVYLSTIRSVVEKFNLQQKFNYIFWIAFIIVTFSILSDLSSFGKEVFLFHVFSESYSFSFILFCLFISFFIEIKKETILSNKNYILFFVISIIALFFTLLFKVSVGFLLWIAISYFLIRLIFTNKNTQSYLKITFFILVLFIFFYSGYKITHSNSNIDVMRISLFNFVNEYASYLTQKTYFYFIYFFWGIIYCILRIRDSKIYTFKSLLKNDNFALIDVELLVVIMIVSALPGIVIAIPGGSAAYFSLVGRQLSMILFLSYIVLHQKQICIFFKKYIFIKKDISFGLIFTFFMISIVFGGIIWKFQVDLRSAYMAHKKLVNDYNDLKKLDFNSTSSLLNRNWAIYITKELDSLGHLSLEEKRKLAIHISQSDTLFWKSMNTKRSAQSISFVVPAISGIMEIDGMPNYEIELYYYGFNSLEKRKNSADTISYSQMCLKAQNYIPQVEKLIIYYPSSHSKKEIFCKKEN